MPISLNSSNGLNGDYRDNLSMDSTTSNGGAKSAPANLHIYECKSGDSVRTIECLSRNTEDLEQDELVEQFQNNRLAAPNEGEPQTQANAAWWNPEAKCGTTHVRAQDLIVEHMKDGKSEHDAKQAIMAEYPDSFKADATFRMSRALLSVRDTSSSTADCPRGRFVAGQRRNCPRKARSRSRSVRPGSEKEWEQRIKKRYDGLNNLWNHEMFEMNQDIPVEDRPFTPDPNDRTLSKRDWEADLGKCREDWRKIHNCRKLISEGFAKKDAEPAWDQANEKVGREEEAKDEKMKMKEDDRTKKTLIMAKCILSCMLNLHEMGVLKHQALYALKQSDGDWNQAVQIIWGR